MIYPVESPVITSPYGPRKMWGKKELHNGIDFVDENDDRRVFAITSGLVTYDMDDYDHLKRWVSPNTGGNMIIVKSQIGNEQYYIRYLHLVENHVAVGQYVNEGDVLGEYDDVGRSSGPHLHVDFWRLNWINFNPAPVFYRNGLSDFELSVEG